ncbi:MAG: hypothetical protein IJD48_01200 [Clostridia bacterium]|nr:hypothetical protein [Clostridia bacterium]MBQ3047613.1 hypothetical protein [Clostridia bacterium]
MTIKQQELQQMQARMYERLESVRENFTSFSPLEKVFFAQQAFNDINAYFCKKYDIPEDYVAFGFLLGRRCSGVMELFPSKYDQNELNPGILMNLGTITKAKDPYAIYRNILHEWYHVLQYEKNFSFGKLAQIALFPEKWQKDQTHKRWLANPSEIEADFGARTEILGIIKTGLSNPETREQASKQLEFFRQERIENIVAHLKGVFKAVKENSEDESIQPRVGEIIGRQPVCFNLLTIASVIGGAPYCVDDPVQMCKIMRDFANNHDVCSFSTSNFFAYNRFYNQNANKLALKLYEKDGLLAFVPDQPLSEEQYMGLQNNKDQNNSGQNIVIQISNEDPTTIDHALIEEALEHISSRNAARQSTGVINQIRINLTEQNSVPDGENAPLPNTESTTNMTE